MTDFYFFCPTLKATLKASACADNKKIAVSKKQPLKQCTHHCGQCIKSEEFQKTRISIEEYTKDIPRKQIIASEPKKHSFFSINYLGRPNR